MGAQDEGELDPMMPALEPVDELGERLQREHQQQMQDMREIEEMQRVREEQQLQLVPDIQGWQGAIQPDGVPVGEHPWDQQLPLAAQQIREVMSEDLGYESAEESTITGEEDPSNMRSFPGSFPSRVEVWSASEIDSWIDVAEQLKERAEEYRHTCNFEGWLQMRYEHDAARTVIGKLLGDLTELRSGTHREVWWVPEKTKRIPDFGDLNWLPGAEVSQEERDAWVQYSDLLDALDTLRKTGATRHVQSILERQVDVAWKGVNKYMEVQKKKNQKKVEDREMAMMELMAKDVKEDREVEQDAGRRAGQRVEGEPAHIVQIDDDVVPIQ